MIPMSGASWCAFEAIQEGGLMDGMNIFTVRVMMNLIADKYVNICTLRAFAANWFAGL
jgi:hypothetical protein